MPMLKSTGVYGIDFGKSAPIAVVVRWLLLGVVLCFLSPTPSRAGGLRLLSVGLRANFSRTDVVGKAAPESFEEYAALVNVGLPWQRYSRSTRRMMQMTGAAFQA